MGDTSHSVSARTLKRLTQDRARTFSGKTQPKPTGTRRAVSQVPAAPHNSFACEQIISPHVTPPRSLVTQCRLELGMGGRTARDKSRRAPQNAPLAALSPRPRSRLLPDGLEEGRRSELRGQQGPPGPGRIPAGQKEMAREGTVLALPVARWQPCRAVGACHGLKNASVLCTQAAGYMLQHCYLCHGVWNLSP